MALPRFSNEVRVGTKSSLDMTLLDLFNYLTYFVTYILLLFLYFKQGLVALFRRHTEIVLQNGGIVRGIENHGVRPLQARAKRFCHINILC